MYRVRSAAGKRRIAEIDFAGVIALQVEDVAFLEGNRGLVQALHLHGRLHPEIVPPTSHDRRASLYVRASELIASSDDARKQIMGRVAVMVLVSTLIEQIVYPDHSPAVAADVSTAELAEELGRMLAGYASEPLG